MKGYQRDEKDESSNINHINSSSSRISRSTIYRTSERRSSKSCSSIGIIRS